MRGKPSAKEGYRGAQPRPAFARSLLMRNELVREATSSLPINGPVSQGKPYEFTFTGGRKGRFMGLHALF